MAVNRRQMIAGISLLPSHVMGGQSGTKAPSDKLNIAGVGVGGMGAAYLKGCDTENIVALCDVDRDYAARTFALYPKAKVYSDYRELLEKEKGIDAVIIGTPDHMHAPVGLAAMQLGKHVYCAKPMTHTVEEARQMARAAREHRVATQMSVQSCASDAAVSTAEWVRAGAVGKVREVHVWTDRPIWPQGIARPKETPAAPESLDWKLWLGAKGARPYHPIYHPFNWRGWVDFGTGALGDMGCHSLHVIVRALELALPDAVQASATFVREAVLDGKRGSGRSRKAVLPETYPMSAMVTWRFGDVQVHWYEGGLKPWSPEPLKNDGILFVGEKGILHSGFSGGPRVLGKPDFTAPPKTMPRSTGHYQEWIRAAKGGPAAFCEFGFGAQLTEIALLGVEAIKAAG